MPSRHNAHLTIHFEDGVRPLHLFLTGGGSPANVRDLARLAMRGKRRQIKVDPEAFAVNLFWYAANRTQVHLTRRESSYAFTYRIDLVPTIPTVHIISEITGNSDRHNLFPWVGSERRTTKEPPADKPLNIKTGKRGRPTGLHKYAVPLPA